MSRSLELLLLADTAVLAQTQRATATGGQGGPPPYRRKALHEEPWHTTDARFGERALRTSRSPCNPVGLNGRHVTLRPRLGTQGFRCCPTARPPAGKGALPLCTPHQGAPGPGEVAPCLINVRDRPASLASREGRSTDCGRRRGIRGTGGRIMPIVLGEVAGARTAPLCGLVVAAAGEISRPEGTPLRAILDRIVRDQVEGVPAAAAGGPARPRPDRPPDRRSGRTGPDRDGPERSRPAGG